MKIDWYTKIILAIIAVSLLGMFLRPYIPSIKRALTPNQKTVDWQDIVNDISK